MSGRDSADKFQFIKISNVENIILVRLSRARVDYQCVPAQLCDVAAQFQ